MKKKKKQQKSTRLKSARVQMTAAGHIAVEYQPAAGEEPQGWTSRTLFEEMDYIIEGGGHGPTYGQFVCVLDMLYSALSRQFGSYAQRITFTFPEVRIPD